MVSPQINDLPPFQPITVIVMAKRAIPGRVKTRLIGELTAQQACKIHLAMLSCIVERIESLAGHARLIAALDAPPPYEPDSLPAALTRPGSRWELLDQGRGDLGERMNHIWRQSGGESAAFFGADTPDAPLEEVLQPTPAPDRTPSQHDHSSTRLKYAGRVCVGATRDGGYWTLAAASYQPILLEGIDWGTDRVYDQTLDRAAHASLQVEKLTIWSDVDEPEDLAQLRRRLGTAKLETDNDQALIRLARALERIALEPMP